MKTIALLEDNDDLRELITFLLEEEQYQVFGYPNVASFNEGLTNGLPDLFLLDVMLPDGNGIDICSALKKDPQTNEIPVIIMSAHAQLSNLSKKCLAQDFIPKPFDIQYFIDRVALQMAG